jgi:molybdate transport system regulatory protein
MRQARPVKRRGGSSCYALPNGWAAGGRARASGEEHGVIEADTPRRRRASRPAAPGGTVLYPRSKVWLERRGEVVLSDWRVALLEAIEATGSLARAAERLDVPYRTAWYKLKEIERRLGVRLLETQSGGADGGGSRLTAEAQEVIARFHRVNAGIEQLIAERFRAEFGALAY